MSSLRVLSALAWLAAPAALIAATSPARAQPEMPAPAATIAPEDPPSTEPAASPPTSTDPGPQAAPPAPPVVPPTPLAASPLSAATPRNAAADTEQDAERDAKRDPEDVFLLQHDDPRIPSFLRALRAGKDSLRLGGWIQPGFTYVTDTDFNDDDADGFEFNNARLLGLGDLDIAHGLGASFRFNFDVNRGNFTVRDTYGSLTFRRDLVALDVGQLKTPLGAALVQSEAKLQFPTSPISRRLAFGRDIGAQLRSDVELGPVYLHGAFMVANGEGGFRQRRNLDDQFVYVGRVELGPLGRMERSESDLENSDFQLTLGLSAGHSSYLGNDLGLQDVGAQETKIEGDVRMWFKGASLRAEYLRGMRGDVDGGPGFDRYALIVQAGYVLPIPITVPQFELVARLQQSDVSDALVGDEGDDYVVDNTETRVLDFGGNVYLAKHAVKFQVVYRLTDLLEGPQVDADGNVLIGDSVLAFFQFAWL